MSDTKKPIETLRDGSIKAAIWENEGSKGIFHNVTFSRTYRDNEGQYKDSNRFSGTDLLKLSNIAERSYEAVQQHRAPKQEQEQTQAPQQQPAPQQPQPQPQPQPSVAQQSAQPQAQSAPSYADQQREAVKSSPPRGPEVKR